jgi:hypothetical protein
MATAIVLWQLSSLFVNEDGPFFGFVGGPRPGSGDYEL